MRYVPQSNFSQISRSIFALLVMVLGGCQASIDAYPKRLYDATVPTVAVIDSIAVTREFYELRTEDERRHYRNAVIAERIAAMNISYRLFEEQLFQEGTVRNIAADWALLGLAGAGATIASSGTQQILAAVSGGLVGARAAFDKNALFDRTLPSLVAKMEASRQQVQERLLNGMKLDTDAYGIIEALGDLESYYNAGTLPGAILNVAGDAGLLKAQIQQRRIFSAKSIDNAGKELLPLLTGVSGTVDRARIAQLRTCFTVVGLPSDILVFDFLYGGEFISERPRVLACMQALPAAVSVSAPRLPGASASSSGSRGPGSGTRGASITGTTSSTLDASKLTDQLEALLIDPANPARTADNVNLATSCFPSSLRRQGVIMNDLLLRRLEFAKEKKAIIDCMAAAKANPNLDPGKLSDELASLLKDPATGLDSRPKRSRAVACYPAGLSPSTRLEELVNNRAGFAKEKKAIIDCMKRT